MLWRMKVCQYCGAALKAEQAFCPNCAEPVNPATPRTPAWDGAATIPDGPAHEQQSGAESEAEGSVLDIYWDKRPARE